MPLIYLETFVQAPPQTVFDLSRSVEVHKESMTHHHEEIIDGISNGLMNKGDTVTWKARHFWKARTLSVAMVQLQSPHSFTDEMIKGDFKSMRHQHIFKPVAEGTLMIDRFYFETPFGVFGRLINVLFLQRYMKKLLQERNAVIKSLAEATN